MTKLDELKKYFQQLGSVAVAYSSGVDSTFLLKIAHDVLGDRCVAITAFSEYFPQRESVEAKEFCEKEGIRQILVASEELEDEAFCQNPKDRCYVCKKALFGKMKEEALRQGLEYVVEGSNVDDLSDYRPGMRAIRELEIKSPLKECGFTKAEIRKCSHELGLPTWKKPSYACLASRIPYGDRITREKLRMVERAERFLMDAGFEQMRVRIHGQIARIEVPEEQLELVVKSQLRKQITEEFQNIGFTYVTLDLVGFRSGSLNETL